jgi:hypothetical protein
MVGCSRNRTEPFARLRDPGGSGHSVAHFLCGFRDLLWLCSQHYILTRISSKCRCAKRERKRDACAPDRPAAQATWSAYCFHDLIVVCLRMFSKLICRRFRPKKRQFQPHSFFVRVRPGRDLFQSVQRKCSRRRLLRRAFASSLRLPPAAASFS